MEVELKNLCIQVDLLINHIDFGKENFIKFTKLIYKVETIKLLQNLLLFRIKEFHKLICFIKYYNKLDKSKTIRQLDPSLFF